jgi:aconitate hydratase
VSQVILGGDSGASLRDLLAAAALLKSKRVPPKLDLLVAPPSRQALEVLAQSGALVDLVATGARLLEPDPRLVTGELYPPPNDGGVSLRTFDPEPSFPASAQRFVVASAETLAFSVATGTVGDPRSFKRPVRVTVPRTLPTDDVLIVRKAKSKSKEAEAQKQAGIEAPKAHPFADAQVLPVVVKRGKPASPSVLVLDSLDDVRWFARRAPELNDTVRALVAPYVPSGIVPMLAGLGILTLVCAEADLGKLRGEATLPLPAPSAFGADNQITLTTSGGPVILKWVALGSEREWTSTGTARSPSPKR